MEVEVVTHPEVSASQKKRMAEAMEEIIPDDLHWTTPEKRTLTKTPKAPKKKKRKVEYYSDDDDDDDAQDYLSQFIRKQKKKTPMSPTKLNKIY